MAWIRGMLKIGLIFLINQAIADQIKVIDLSKSYNPNQTKVTENHNTSTFDPLSKTNLEYYGHNEDEKFKKGNYLMLYKILCLNIKISNSVIS